MANCSEKIAGDGLRTIRLDNELMSVALVPEVGGKITEIHDKRSGRNWLWKNPYLPLRIPSADLDFEKDLDSGGWDEVLFSLSPCNLQLDNGQSHAIPGHGDVVRRRWNVDELAEGEFADVSCRLSASCERIGYRLSRIAQLHATKARLILSYSMDNIGSQSLPFYWSAHPLFAPDAGMHLSLPDGQAMRVSDTNNVSASEGEHRWPALRTANGETTDVSECFGESSPRIATKLFIDAPDPGRIELRIIDRNERLTILFDNDNTPWIGCWINNQAWSGSDSKPYRNIGIEPSSARFDSLDDVINAGAAELLAPGDTRTWSLELRLIA